MKENVTEEAKLPKLDVTQKAARWLLLKKFDKLLGKVYKEGRLKFNGDEQATYVDGEGVKHQGSFNEIACIIWDLNNNHDANFALASSMTNFMPSDIEKIITELKGKNKQKESV